MKAKSKPVKGSARTKRFDRGGTVGALAGLGTLAYLMNKKGSDDTNSGESTAKPKIAEIAPRDTTMQDEDTRFPKKAEAPSEPEQSKSYKAEPGEGYAKPVKPITKSTSTAKPKTASQSFPLTKSGTEEARGSQSFPLTKSGIEPKGGDNESRPSKPYPTGVKGKEKDPFLSASDITPKKTAAPASKSDVGSGAKQYSGPSGKAGAQNKAVSMFKTDTAEYDANNARYQKQLDEAKKSSDFGVGRNRAGVVAGSRLKTDTSEYDANNARYKKQLEDVKKESSKSAPMPGGRGSSRSYGEDKYTSGERGTGKKAPSSTYLDDNRLIGGMKKGGKVKKYAEGGTISAAPAKDNRRPKGDTGIAEIWTAGKGKPPMDDDSGSIPKGTVKKAKGGSIRSSASKRGDGCAIRGKTRA